MTGEFSSDIAVDNVQMTQGRCECECLNVKGRACCLATILILHKAYILLNTNVFKELHHVKKFHKSVIIWQENMI